MARSAETIAPRLWRATVDEAQEFFGSIRRVEANFSAFTSEEVSAALIGWKPLESEALGFHPSQLAEARALDEKRGVVTDYTPTGEPIFRSRQHRKEYMNAHGWYDRDAGYSDAQRGSFKGDKPEHNSSKS